MANYKAKVEFSGKAGSFKPGDDFNTDKAYGQFLVDMGYAEFVSENEPEKKAEVAETDEGHK